MQMVSNRLFLCTPTNSHTKCHQIKKEIQQRRRVMGRKISKHLTYTSTKEMKVIEKGCIFNVIVNVSGISAFDRRMIIRLPGSRRDKSCAAEDGSKPLRCTSTGFIHPALRLLPCVLSMSALEEFSQNPTE